MIYIPGHLWRLFRTAATFERNGAMRELLDAFEVPRAARVAMRAVGRLMHPFGVEGDAGLPPVARALQAMGPAYVKFGQILSTRPDIVGATVVRQLRYLQDRLPPFGLEEARDLIEADLGPEVWEVIGDLEPSVAAASIAQVHPAVWKPTGERVAVKVLRPNVREQFRRDIGAFYFIARTIEFLVPGTRRLRPTAIVEHFESVVLTELDLRLEAAAASQFRDNNREDPLFYVPAVFWQATGRRVLTLEWVEGLPIESEALTRAGIDLTELAERVLAKFLYHALHDGFFHADMHQGNLRMRPDGTLVALDFGIMGRLDPITRRHYAEILYGFLTRDYRRVAEVHFEAGYVPHDRDVEAFALALRSIGEPIFGQDVSRISMARLLAYLLETTERFGMETRTELILLQRTMVVVEGVARSLDPHTNIWRAAAPVVEDWVRDRLGPKQMLRDAAETLVVLSRLGPRMSGIADELVMAAEQMRTKQLRGPLRIVVKELPTRSYRLPMAVSFLVGGAIGAVLMIMTG